MATKKTGLGRSLNALLSGVLEKNKYEQTDAAADFNAEGDANLDVDSDFENTPLEHRETHDIHDTQEKNVSLLEIDLEHLVPGVYQPRREIHQAELETLADSIRAQGVLQPILVRSKGNKYEIIAGERRFRASQLAGLSSIPAIIKTVPDEAAMAMALIENIQRENLNPLEEAIALERLSKEFNLTHAEVADAVGKSRTAVTNLLRLLNLNEDVKLLLEKNDLELGHAKVLLSLRGVEQSHIARMVVAKSLSVRETEKLVARVLDSGLSEPKASRYSDSEARDPNIRQLQDELSEQLCAIVKISHSKKGRGKIVIQYNSLDELDGILGHIQQKNE